MDFEEESEDADVQGEAQLSSLIARHVGRWVEKVGREGTSQLWGSGEVLSWWRNAKIVESVALR